MRPNNYLRETLEMKLQKFSPEIAVLRQKTLERKATDIQAKQKIILARRSSNATGYNVTPLAYNVTPLANNVTPLANNVTPLANNVKHIVPGLRNIPVENIAIRREIPGNLVCPQLGHGIGNRIFQVLAALGYAEKYGKKCVISKANSRDGSKPHEKNLDGMLFKIFPNVPVVDRIDNARVITEVVPFNYNTLSNSLSNVILQGYFQDERYFPSEPSSSGLIPKIKTGHYPNTYFIHIRAGDYLYKGSFGYDLSYYHKRCFDMLSSDTKYIVFSDDIGYARNYMKQFSISYTISDKVNQLDTLIEMSNCEGAICANSSFSWLGAFFQDKTKGNRFMPSRWIIGNNCNGIYPTWATVVDTSTSKGGIEISENSQHSCNYIFSEWQKVYKDPYRLIVQASSICGGDLWMPFPIGMGWRYVKCFNNNPAWQIGPHDKLVLCAILTYTDTRRRPTGLNRSMIVSNLEKKGITNIQLTGADYFNALPTYKFIISPEGNGIDCHRHYEALMAGCIPIIEYNEQIEEKYSGLPILYTNDYSEITPAYLENKYNKMINQQYDFSRLFLSYYSNEEQEEIRKCGTYWIKRWCGQEVEWYKNKPEEIKWITIINYGYIEFTRNFLESMNVYNSHFNITIYCLDKETMDALKDYSNVTCIDTSSIINNSISSSFSKWGETEYKTVCFYKLDAISHALKNNYNISIGYIDTDIIVMKDPTNTIIRNMNIFRHVDLFTQCDENKYHKKCSNPNKCPNFCAGICIFRNNSRTIDLVDYKKRDITKNFTDQDYLLEICNRNDIKRITISRDIFLNGEYPGVNNNTILSVPPFAELIHYNYIIGKDKVKYMKKNHMWFI